MWVVDFGVIQVERSWQTLDRKSTRLNSSHGYISYAVFCLKKTLRKYVDERASDKDVYATPSEYIRDLIRQDMQDRAIAVNILEGLDDLKHGRYSSKSILTFKNED